MQQHIYDQREQPQHQHQQLNEYPYISGTPEDLHEPLTSSTFTSSSLYEQSRPYQEGYAALHESTSSSDFAPPLRQQVHYVPVYPSAFRVQEPGADGKILAALSYVGLWVTGLLVLLFVRENRFVRFHALQSLLFYSGAMLLYIIAPFAFMGFWDIRPFVPMIAAMGFFVVTIVAIVAWFVGLVGALSGKCYKLPLAGDLAELLVKPHETGTVK